MARKSPKATKLSPKAGKAPGGILSGPMLTQPTNTGMPGSSGWGIGNPGARSATGQNPKVNPWIIPKAAGLSHISQTYPSNYFVEWTPSNWRAACDKVMKQGWTVELATMYAWAYESSPFIQSLFRTIETAVNSIKFYYLDKRGNIMPDWTDELCNKPWQIELRREMAFSFFWGFSGINIDPVGGRIYKYPMQDLDPLNRFLRQSTYAFYDGIFFEEWDNLLWLQPNTNVEGYLGWMQAIVRLYILMHLNNENWVQAGKRLAFPVFTIGYPEGSDMMGDDGQIVNPYRDEAYEISKDLGPGKTVVFPYVRKADGEIQKNLELEFQEPGSTAKAHSIYLDANETFKNEIRELVFGGSLTADAGDKGSRALGEVQERKFRTFMLALVEYILAVHNDDYKNKISRYYKGGIPEGRFDIDRAKQFTIEEIVAWSAVLSQSGQRFAPAFFEAQGLPPEFIEDSPTAAPAGGGGLSKKDDGRIQELHTQYANQRGARSWFH